MNKMLSSGEPDVTIRNKNVDKIQENLKSNSAQLFLLQLLNSIKTEFKKRKTPNRLFNSLPWNAQRCRELAAIHSNNPAHDWKKKQKKMK